MTDALDALVDLLALEKLEENLFRGQSQDLGLPQLFGGQALGQAVSAASQTVVPERQIHSVHGYFLRPGDARWPVVYQVDRVRDGGSFTTRRVTAIQNGKPIFFCSASFQGAETSLSHYPTMPSVPSPEVLLNEGQSVQQRFEHHPIEFLSVEAIHDMPPRQRFWFRMRGELPDCPVLHRQLLAYASDFNLLPTSLLAHDIDLGDARVKVASLDHALWIHANPRLNDWLLYDIDSPWAGGARGLARGSLYDRHGVLIASVTQEGLLRMQS